ncbi:hypothetical protein [Pedobacter sp. MW01-1-1]|uniref:hypothetical protein n=1 Tax=Pedobacter sp. MW01-1-1 TaxID=3383027 RepID=UPI003FF01522
MENLLGVTPAHVLLHGPTKTLLDTYHWHEPNVGIVASYTPTAFDVQDHFGLFRGVDQIEAFAQATIVSCAGFLEYKKHGGSFEEVKEKFVPVFISIGNVHFHHYIEEGETFVSLGIIKFNKFRQMVCDGRIYKVLTKNLNLDAYFSAFTTEKLTNYTLSDDFKLVAELFDITGRALKKEKLNP